MHPLGRPKDLQKREQILQAATALFLQLGYDGCSMNKIATYAGVTKLTVYNHFQDKENLFVCAIERACDQNIAPEQLELNANSNFMAALTLICEHCLRVVYLPEALKLEYLMLQLAANQNELATKFFNASHRRMQLVIEQFMARAAQLGFIREDQPAKQNQLLMSLLCGLHFHHVLLGVREIPTAQERQCTVEHAIGIFMQHYQPA